MSYRNARYCHTKFPFDKLSNADAAKFQHLSKLALQHDSNGSYSMAAGLYKPKFVAVGFNQLNSPSITKHSAYPDHCQLHAELALWDSVDIKAFKNSIVVIHGVVSHNRNPMTNTIPCRYCAALLISCKVKRVICTYKGEPISIKPQHLNFERNKDVRNNIAA